MPLSLADTLDEENRETLASLPTERASTPTRRRFNSGQPFPVRNISTDMPVPRHGSIAGIGVGVTSPRQKKEAESRLDPSDPSTWTRKHSSKPNSPTLTRAQPAVTRPDGDPGADETQGYVGIPRVDTTHRAMSDSGPARPRDSPRSGALAAALSGELEQMVIKSKEGPQEKHLQRAAAHSRSPSGRVVDAPSPSGPKTLSPDDHGDSHRPSGSFSTVASSDVGRAELDHGQENAVEEYSDEHHSTDSEDDSRGRDRDPKAKEAKDAPTRPTVEPPSSPEPAISITAPDGESSSAAVPATPLVTEPTQPLLPTQPNPTSAQDLRRGSVSTIGSHDGDDDDIAKAKTLGLSISPLDTNVPDRHVRMIIRGDWLRYHKEAEAGERSVRTYLACSDLSVEANYALEWTVGTILRDGDTLLCVYSIEDESAGSAYGSSGPNEAEKEKLHEEGHQAGKDAINIMEGLTRQTTKGENQPMTKFIPATEAKSLTGSVDARTVGRKEMERLKAIDEITQTFLKLVRKTSLQVRCMIEVIHCKSPKHLILGAVSLPYNEANSC